MRLRKQATTAVVVAAAVVGLTTTTRPSGYIKFWEIDNVDFVWSNKAQECTEVQGLSSCRRRYKNTHTHSLDLVVEGLLCDCIIHIFFSMCKNRFFPLILVRLSRFVVVVVFLLSWYLDICS